MLFSVIFFKKDSNYEKSVFIVLVMKHAEMKNGRFTGLITSDHIQTAGIFISRRCGITGMLNRKPINGP